VRERERERELLVEVLVRRVLREKIPLDNLKIPLDREYLQS